MAKKQIHYEIQPTDSRQYDLPIVDDLRQMDVSKIPAEFIECIDVEYNNGALIRINGEDVIEPILIEGGGNKTKKTQTLFKNVSHITIMINFDEFYLYIEEIINGCFSPHLATDIYTANSM